VFEALKPGDMVSVCFQRNTEARKEPRRVESVRYGQIWVEGFRYPFATANGLYMPQERTDERVFLEI
jgi:hypothetical protein